MKHLITLLCLLAAESFSAVTVAQYYDDRDCALVWIYDGLITGYKTDFESGIDHAQSNKVVVTVGTTSDNCDSATWSMLQTQIGEGYCGVMPYSTDAYNPTTYVDGDQADIIDRVIDARQDVFDNLTLPATYTYNGSEYITSRIQPWGTATNEANAIDWQAFIRDVMSTNNYLFDRAVNGYGGPGHDSIDWEAGVGDKGLFERVGSVSVANNIWTDFDWHTNQFQTAIDSNQIYVSYFHTGTYGIDPPLNEAASNAYNMIEWWGHRDNVWYADANHAAAYLYLSTVSTSTVSVISETSKEVHFSVTAPTGKRSLYGLSWPISYKVDKPSGWDASTPYLVEYKDSGNWQAVTQKALGDWHNDVSCYRDTATQVIVNQGLPQSSDSFQIRVKRSQLLPAFFTAGGG